MGVRPGVRHADFLQSRTTSREFFHYVHERRTVPNPRKGTEIGESCQRFHNYSNVKPIHALQFVGRIVDCDPLNNRGESFVPPDPPQHLPRQRHCLVASNFQQGVGGVVCVRVREAYFKVAEEALQRDKAMKVRYE